jgi:hypothetical protein
MQTTNQTGFRCKEPIRRKHETQKALRDFGVGDILSIGLIISSVSDSAIAITNRDKETSIISLYRPEEPEGGEGATQLVFHKYGGKYFLSQVARGFGGNTIQLPTSKLEREAQAQSARSTSDRQVVFASK